MVDTLSAEDMTVAGVVRRLLAILQEAGFQTRQHYTNTVIVSGSDTDSSGRIDLRIECGSTWRVDDSKPAARISVVPPYHHSSKFKIANYAVKNGEFNQDKILARVRSGLDYLAEIDKQDKERQKRYDEKERAEELELGGLQAAIEKAGVEINRLDGDRQRYRIKWDEFVDLDKLPALLQALALARS